MFPLKRFLLFFFTSTRWFPTGSRMAVHHFFYVTWATIVFSLLGCVYRCFAAIRMLQRSDVGVLVKWYFHLSIKLELLVFILLEDILFYTKDFLMIFRNDVVHFVVRRNTHTHTHTHTTHTHKHNFGHEKIKTSEAQTLISNPYAFSESECVCVESLSSRESERML